MLYRPVNCGPLELRPAKETPLGGGLVALAVDTPDGAGVIDVGTLDRGEVELLRDACDEALQ